MNITKKQHYIPQFYLKNFADNNKIWILDKNNNKIYKNSIENVCTKNYLYETKWKEPFMNQKFISVNMIEKNLSIKEGEYATLLRQIIKMCKDKSNENSLIMNAQQKKLIAEFISNIFVRHPLILENCINYIKNIKYPEELASLKEVCDLVGILDFNSLLEHSYKNTLTFENEKGAIPYFIKKAILDLNMYIWKTPSEMTFMTSSFPIIYNIVGISEKQLSLESLFFPITPTLGIFYNQKKNKGFGRINKISELLPEKVNKFNLMYLSKSEETQFILSANEKSLRELKNINRR